MLKICAIFLMIGEKKPPTNKKRKTLSMQIGKRASCGLIEHPHDMLTSLSRCHKHPHHPEPAVPRWGVCSWETGRFGGSGRGEGDVGGVRVLPDSQ